MQNINAELQTVLEKRIGYRFKDRNLLTEALTHRSKANETAGRMPDNQRLEFLGDSILGFVIGRELFGRYPSCREGELTRMRAVLVDGENLARLAIGVDLGSCLILGKGEERSGGRSKRSLLADAYEALIAAVYLDGGMPAVQRIIKRQFGQLLDEVLHGAVTRDYKTELQEFTQSGLSVTPEYKLLETVGPDHDRVYRVAVLVGGKAAGEGSGRSKKEAQQAAARMALETLAR